MALARMVGRPISVIGTVPTVNCTYLKSIVPIQDPELHKDMAGNSQLPYFFQGEKVLGIKFTTPDLAVYAAYKKGTYVGTITGLAEGIRDSAGTKQGSAEVIEVEVVKGVVTEVTELDSTPEGSTKDVTYTVMASHDAAGAEGSGTVTETLS